jgi:hypothetical protein
VGRKRDATPSTSEILNGEWMAMISVDLLVTEIGRLTTKVGRIDFYKLPVQNQGDFLSVPTNIASLEMAQAISLELARQVVRGKVGRYEWRKHS